jgi:hypothetical protein
MTTQTLLLTLGLFSLVSCGRQDTGCILNKTDDTLTLTLKLNFPANEFKPDNYFREEIIKKEKSKTKDFKLAGDCLVEFDTSTNIATFRLNPKDKINLGTIRMPLKRSDYRTWEFREISITGHNFELNAKDKGIMTLIEKDNHWDGQESYSLTIGQR